LHKRSATVRIGLDGVPGDCGNNATYIGGIYKVSVSGLPVYINSNGQLGVKSSSLRFKEQVRDMGDSSDALMQLAQK
jgi:hypothetical protein